MSRGNAWRQRGVTLIELMVALVLGIIVAGGIITVFMSTSGSNKVQNQMARMQEDGRFAVGRMNDDLAMANGMYCNNTGGIATSTSSGVSLDGLRTPQVFAKKFLETPALFENTTTWATTSGTNTYPAAPAAKYAMPSFLFMRGYSCAASGTCLPIDPAFLGGTAATAGTALGNRVIGTDVLTVRYLNASRGWKLGSTSKVTSNPVDSTVTSISMVAASDEPPLSDFKSKIALLADCSNAQIFQVTGNGTGTVKPDAANNFAVPLAPQPQSAPRLFDFVNDMQNVTYYVQVVTDDGTATGSKTGALMRRINGTTVSVPDQELIRGVERLTFRYGVEQADGTVMFLTADQVDSRAGGTITCPPTATALGTTDPGCLWRAVKSIQASLLVAGSATLPNLTANELGFVFTPDSTDGSNSVVLPTETDTKKLAIRPSAQGFDDKRLRREFTTVVSLRNYNP